MDRLKMILLFIGAFLLQNTSKAQNKVSFVYDTAGNRISRSIVVSAPPLKSAAEEEEEPTVYSEVLSELLIKIYPNPTQGLLHIEIANLPADVVAHIALYQLSGNQIVSKQTSGSTEIDLTGQSAGTYLMRIIAGKEQTEWKIIKK
jgi:hypothetical protein